MKKLFLVATLAAGLAACGQVKPGHVGIKINQYGSGAGVDPVPLGVGTYFTPIGTNIIAFPVSTTTYVWSHASDEGAQANEEIRFQDRSGVDMAADVGAAIHVDSIKAPILYQKYRMDIQSIVDGPLRNVVRNALVTRAAQLPVEEIYGPAKAQLINAALADARAYFAPFGLDVEQLYWASSIRVPESISKQITARVANENAALAAQAAVATATAEANAVREAARGKADAMSLEATALRQNPEIAQLRAIEAWDGALPKYVATSGALPFIGKVTP